MICHATICTACWCTDQRCLRNIRNTAQWQNRRFEQPGTGPAAVDRQQTCQTCLRRSRLQSSRTCAFMSDSAFTALAPALSQRLLLSALAALSDALSQRHVMRSRSASNCAFAARNPALSQRPCGALSQRSFAPWRCFQALSQRNPAKTLMLMSPPARPERTFTPVTSEQGGRTGLRGSRLLI